MSTFVFTCNKSLKCNATFNIDDGHVNLSVYDLKEMFF